MSLKVLTGSSMIFLSVSFVAIMHFLVFIIDDTQLPVTFLPSSPEARFLDIICLITSQVVYDILYISFSLTLQYSIGLSSQGKFKRGASKPKPNKNLKQKRRQQDTLPSDCPNKQNDGRGDRLCAQPNVAFVWFFEKESLQFRNSLLLCNGLDFQ